MTSRLRSQGSLFVALVVAALGAAPNTAVASQVIDDTAGRFAVDLLGTQQGLGVDAPPGRVNVTVNTAAGVATQSNAALPGVVTFTEVTPTSFNTWISLNVAGSQNQAGELAATLLTCEAVPQVVPGFNAVPVPAGGTLSLAAVDAASHPCLAVRVTLTNGDGAIPPVLDGIELRWQPKPVHGAVLNVPATAAAGETFNVRAIVSTSYVNAQDVVAYVTLPTAPLTILNQQEAQSAAPTFVAAQNGGVYTAIATTVAGVAVPANSVYWRINQNAGATGSLAFTLKVPTGCENDVWYDMQAVVSSPLAETVLSDANPLTPAREVSRLATTSTPDYQIWKTQYAGAAIVASQARAVVTDSLTGVVSLLTVVRNQNAATGRETAFSVVTTSDLAPLVNFLTTAKPAGCGVASSAAALALITPRAGGVLNGGSQTVSWTHTLVPGATANTQIDVNFASCFDNDGPGPQTAVTTGLFVNVPTTSQGSNTPLQSTLHTVYMGVELLPEGIFAHGDVVRGVTQINPARDDNELESQAYESAATYLLLTENQSAARVDDVMMVEKIPFGATFSYASLQANANGFIYYTTDATYNDPALPPPVDPRAAPGDIDVPGNVLWQRLDLSPPADLSQITWVGFYVPCVASAIFPSPPGSACEGAPSRVIGQVGVRLPNAPDVCVAEDRTAHASFYAFGASNSISNGDADMSYPTDGLGDPTPATGSINDIETTHLGPPSPEVTDLSVQMAGPTAVIVGQQPTYTVTVKNDGDFPSFDTKVKFPVPVMTVMGQSQPLTIAAVTGGQVEFNLPTDIIVNVGTLPAGATATVTLKVVVPTGGILDDRYNVLALVSGRDLNNCSPYEVSKVINTGVSGQIALSGTKSALQSAVDPGGTLQFRIQAGNFGQLALDGVYLIDRVPAKMRFVEAYTSGALDLVGNPFDCDGCQVYFAKVSPSLPATPGPATPITGAMVEQFFVQGVQTAPGTWAPPAGFGSLAEVAYVAYKVDDVSVTPPQLSAGTIKQVGVTMVNLEANGQPSAAGTLLSNVAYVTGNSLSGVVTNVARVVVFDQPGLQIDLTSELSVRQAGDSYDYTLTYFNDASDPDTEAVLEVVLPAGLSLGGLFHTYDAATLAANPGFPAGEVAISGGAFVTVTPNADGTQTVRVVIASATEAALRAGALPFPEGGQLRLAVTASPALQSGVVLPATANACFANATQSGCLNDNYDVVISNPSLSITKFADNTSPLPGEEVGYVITIQNHGGVAAPNVVIADVLPAGICFVPGSSLLVTGGYTVAQPTLTGGDCLTAPSQLVWNTLQFGAQPMQTVPANSGPIILRYRAVVGAAVPAGTSLTNGASVSTSGIEDPTFANETEAEVVTPLPDPAVTASLPATVLPGQSATLAISIANAARLDANNAVTIASLPDYDADGQVDVTFESATAAGTQIFCHAGPLTAVAPAFNPAIPGGAGWGPCAPGGVAYVAFFAPTLASQSTIAASVQFAALEPDTGNNLPAGVTLTSAVTVTAAEDADTTNNAAQASTKTPGADLAIAVAATYEGGAPGILPGAQQTYTLTVSSQGTEPICDTFATLTLPAGMTFASPASSISTLVLEDAAGSPVSALTPAGQPILTDIDVDLSLTGATLRFDFGGASVCLPPGSRFAFDVVALASENVASGTVLSATAVVGEDSAAIEDVVTNNSAISFAVAVRADVVVQKTGGTCGNDAACSSVSNSLTIDAGDTLQYTISYGNVGTAAATAPLLTDALPAGVCLEVASLESQFADDVVVSYSSDGGASFGYAPSTDATGTDCAITHFQVAFADLTTGESSIALTAKDLLGAAVADGGWQRGKGKAGTSENAPYVAGESLTVADLPNGASCQCRVGAPNTFATTAFSACADASGNAGLQVVASALPGYASVRDDIVLDVMCGTEHRRVQAYTHPSLQSVERCAPLEASDEELFALAADYLPTDTQFGPKTSLANPYLTVDWTAGTHDGALPEILPGASIMPFSLYRSALGPKVKMPQAAIDWFGFVPSIPGVYSESRHYGSYLPDTTNVISLRKRFGLSSDQRFLAMRREFSGRRNGVGCEMGMYIGEESDSGQTYQKRFCDVIIMNAQGQAVCVQDGVAPTVELINNFFGFSRSGIGLVDNFDGLAGDLDNDTRTDAQEAIDGTDPNDPCDAVLPYTSNICGSEVLGRYTRRRGTGSSQHSLPGMFSSKVLEGSTAAATQLTQDMSSTSSRFLVLTQPSAAVTTNVVPASGTVGQWTVLEVTAAVPAETAGMTVTVLDGVTHQALISGVPLSGSSPVTPINIASINPGEHPSLYAVLSIPHDPAGEASTKITGMVIKYKTTGGLASFNYRARVVDATELTSSELLNQAFIETSTPQISADNDQASHMLFVRTADITAVVTLGATVGQAGNDVEAFVNICNQGPQDGRNVVGTVNLPTGIVLADAGGCAVAGNVLTCEAGDLAVGECAEFVLVGELAPGVTVGEVVTVPVTATTTTYDPNLTNNSDNEGITIGSFPNVLVTLTAPPVVVPGQPFVLAATYANNGNAPADAPTLTFTLPPGVTLVSIEPDSGALTCEVATGICTFVGPLGANEGGSLELVVISDASTIGVDELAFRATIATASTQSSIDDDVADAISLVDSSAGTTIAGRVMRDRNADGTLGAGDTGAPGSMIFTAGQDEFGRLYGPAPGTTAYDAMMPSLLNAWLLDGSVPPGTTLAELSSLAAYTVVAPVSVDAAGNYAVVGLPAGTYNLYLEPAGGLALGGSDGGQLGAVTDNSPTAARGHGLGSLETGVPAGAAFINGIQLLPLDVTVENNFLVFAGSLSGSIFVDDNRNREREAGEPLTGAGIEVTLYQDTNGDGIGDVAVAVTVTDANGNYTFTDVAFDVAYVVAPTGGFADPAHTRGQPSNPVTLTLASPTATGVDASIYTFTDVDMSVPAVTQLAVPVAGQAYPAGQTVTCTNASISADALNATCEVSGLPAGLTATCTPASPVAVLAAGDAIVCTISGTPTTNAPIAATVVTGADGDGVTFNNEGVLTSGPSADMSVPAINNVAAPEAGVAYPAGQTVTCTNAGALAAINATCEVVGLPPGLTATCNPPSPVASLDPGESIVCTISGTPTTNAPIDANVVTNAENDGHPENNEGLITSTPRADMAVTPVTELAPPVAGETYPPDQTVTCTNESPEVAAINARCVVADLPPGLISTCTPPSPQATLAPGASIVCTISGTPITDEPIASPVSTNADNDGTPGNNLGEVTSPVGSDIQVPAFTQLPAPESGVAYPAGQTVSCTNNGAAPAANATCVVAGLPDGLIATCTPTSPQAVLAVGASITCTISGTPTSDDPIVATITGGAENDTQPANNEGNLGSEPAADMGVDLVTELAPPIAGVPYPPNQVVVCTNLSATEAAINATCEVIGLPPGLTSTCDPSAPVASLPPGGTIECTISGTPETNAPITGTVSTDADNDGGDANNDGVLISDPTANMAVAGVTELAPPVAGQPYPGDQVVLCTNTSTTTTATNATCDITGLPEGLTAECTPPSPTAALAPGESIVCEIVGTPTSSDPIDATVETGADNDGDPSDDEGTIVSPPSNLSLSGGGCAAGGAQGGPASLLAGLLIAGYVLRRRRVSAKISALAVAVAVTAIVSLASAPAAHAQAVDGDTQFPAERFRLSSEREGILSVDSARTIGHLKLDAGLWIGYANDPVNINQDGERLGSLVSDRYGGSFVATLGLGKRFQLSAMLPLVISQQRDLGPITVPDAKLTKFGLSDIQLTPKLSLLRGTVDIAVAAAIGTPTSSSTDFFGNDGFAVSPELLIEHRGSRYRVGLNLGYLVRKSQAILDLDVDDELYLHAGVGYLLTPKLDAMAAFSLATLAKDPFGPYNNNHSEARVGLGYTVARNWKVFSAAGAGIGNGFGTPDWRVLAGLWFGSARDEAPAKKVAPPPEPVDGDRDGDGFLDSKDACPDEAETVNGTRDDDGCPEADPDADRVYDADDQCPNEAEDVDQFQDQDGCPDPDNDGDGILDGLDVCPSQPGVPATSGCPDPDRDGDTVVDRLDVCPDVPGTVEHSGCPTATKVKLNDDVIDIIDQVYFDTDKDTIQKRSYQLLNDVAGVLISHPNIKVEVQGHTDDRGSDAYNLDLSGRRAAAVVRYLTARAVPAERLSSQGYGESQPLGPNTTKQGRAKNRRVVFKILGGQSHTIEQQGSGPTGPIKDER